MFNNHVAENIATKGFMNDSAASRGIVLFIPIETVRRRGLSPDDYGSIGIKREEISLPKEVQEYPKGPKKIDYIPVHIKWNKRVDRVNKEIYAELIDTKIEAVLIDGEKKYVPIDDNIILDYYVDDVRWRILVTEHGFELWKNKEYVKSVDSLKDLFKLDKNIEIKFIK